MSSNITRRAREDGLAGCEQGFDAVLPMALEPRFMFDAAGAATGAEAAQDAQAEAEAENAAGNASDPSDVSDRVSADQDVSDMPTAAGDSGETRNVALVDKRIQGYEAIADGFGNDTKVIVFESDGTLDQLASLVSGFGNLDTVHIVSHGATGSITLGGGAVTEDILDANADVLAQFGTSLSETGDILLYGCNVGSDQSGMAFVEKLAALTGADVAASDDLTGAANLGGDWDLEIAAGTVETSSAIPAAAQAGFAGVLTAPQSENFNGVNVDHTGGISDETISQTINGWIYTIHNSSPDGQAWRLYTPDENDTYGDFYSGIPYLVAVPGGDGTAGQGFDYFSVKSGRGEFNLNGFTIKIDPNLDNSNPAFLNIKGYRDGNQVATLNKQEASPDASNGNVTQISSGDLADFKNIDEFRITVYEAIPGQGTVTRTNFLLIDNIEVNTNTAPSLGGEPGDATVTEDVAKAIDLSAYNVTDGDGDTIKLTLAVDAGTIASTDGNGTTDNVTIEMSGTSSMTLSGSAANLNTYLNDTSKIVYTPAANATASATLTVTPNDGTVDGTADTVTITINAVNDAPEATNLTQIKTWTEDDSSVALDAIVVSDVEGDTITATLTLGNKDAGTLTTGTFGAATSVYNAATGIWTVTGNVTDVNAALAAVAFAPTANWDQNVTITTRIRDSGNAGPEDGEITLNVTAVNDAPEATNLSQTKTWTEDDSSVALDAIVVSDVEGDTITATLTLGNKDAGTLTTGAFGAATSVYNAATGIWTVTGNVTDVNAALAAVAFTPAANWDQNVTITTRIRDSSNAGPAEGAIALNVTAVNDAPTLVATGTNPTYVEGAGPSVLFESVTVSTVEEGQSFDAMTLRVEGVADGAAEQIVIDGSYISLTDGNTATTETNSLTVSVAVTDGVATLGFSGAILSSEQMTTLIKGLSYRNTSDNPDYEIERKVTITGLKDSGGTANGGQDGSTPNLQSNVFITAVNDAPTATVVEGGTKVVTVTEDTVGNFDLSDIRLADAENNRLTVTIVVSAGTFSTPASGAAIGSGVTATLENSTTVQLVGSAADINSYLSTASNLQYQGAQDAAGGAAATYTINVNDGTDNAQEFGGTINITAVNDAPTLVATGTNPTYVEGAGPSVLFESVTVSTVEEGQSFDAMTLRVEGVADGAAEQIVIDGSYISLTDGNTATTETNSLTVSVAVTDGVATLGFSGAILSSTQMKTLIEGLSYRNTSDNPDYENGRKVTITGLKDSGGTANGGQDGSTPNLQSNVSITAVNDAPTATVVEGGTKVVTVTEDTVGNFDLSDIRLADAENNRLTVTIVVSAGTFSTPASGAAIGSGVTATLESSTTVQLVGSAADINSYLSTASNLQYQGAQDAAGGAAATYTINVNDGTDNAQEFGGTIDITAVNDAPTIKGISGDSVSYKKGDTLILDVGQDALISDIDSTHFNNGTLTVSIGAGGVAGEDILTLVTSGTTITLSGTQVGSEVRVGGQLVGTLGKAIAAGNDLVINFGPDATPARVQELVRAVAYENSAAFPTAVNRTVGFSLSDGHDTSRLAETTIVVIKEVIPPPSSRPTSGSGSTPAPILQSPGNTTGGDTGTPISNAINSNVSGGNNGGSGIAGSVIPTIVSGQLGDSSLLGKSGTPVSAGLASVQAEGSQGASPTFSITPTVSITPVTGRTAILGNDGAVGGGLVGSVGGAVSETGSSGGPGDGAPGNQPQDDPGDLPFGQQPGGSDEPVADGADAGTGDQASLEEGEAEAVFALSGDFSGQLAAFGSLAELEAELLAAALMQHKIPA